MSARDHQPTLLGSWCPLTAQLDSLKARGQTRRRYPTALSNLFTLFEPIAVPLRLTKWRTKITVHCRYAQGRRRQESGKGHQMTYSGILARSRGLALLAALSAAATPRAAVRSADAMPGYDGVWSVVMASRRRHLRYVLPLPDPRHQRHLRAIAGTATVSITGKVGENGAVVVNVKRRRQDRDRHRPSRWEERRGLLERRQRRLQGRLAGRAPQLNPICRPGRACSSSGDARGLTRASLCLSRVSSSIVGVHGPEREHLRARKC